jgi:hypothetical protein
VKNVGRFAVAALVVYLVGGILLRVLSVLFGFVSLAVAGIVVFGLGYLAGRAHDTK